MKKFICLLLALASCLALCACGGMPGKKAAALYPDIIGEWGTDFFGEDHVLTLSEDGTCMILGNTGTWKLDEKKSTEEYVILTLKTEQMGYYVKFDRAQKDRRYMFNSVELLVMDAKQETTIYEDYVHTHNDEFIPSELALQTIPEVIGEWGSYYWAEEPVFTVREDGTCSVARQPGRWCLWREFSTWPKAVLLIKLDNGLQYECEFVIRENMDYSFASFDFYDRVENRSLYLAPDSDTSIIRAVNRSRVEDPAEAFSWVLGSWESTEPLVTFNEDGTCVLRGAEGVWTVDYGSYSPEWSRWVTLLVKVQGQEYRVQLNDTGDTVYMGIYLSDGVEVVRSTSVTKDAG